MNPKSQILVILAVLATTACASRPSDRVARDVSTVREERAPDKLVARGVAFAGVGDLTRAEQYFAAALDAGADPDVVLPKLLRVCINSGNHLAAISYATPLLERHPDDVDLRFVVAELRAVTGDTEGARADLAKVVALAPEEPAPHFAYARLLKTQMGDAVGADHEYREYLRVAPTGEHADESRSQLLVATRLAPSVSVAPVRAAHASHGPRATKVAR